MYLFTIVTETLLQKLNKEVTGYRLAGMRESITTPSYADDITVTLAKEEQGQRAIDIIAEFGKASGLQVHKQKTKGISFHRKRPRSNG